MPFQLADSQLVVSGALPNGATSTTTPGIDLCNMGDFQASCELLISAPELSGTELPNGATMTYAVEDATAANFSDVVTLFGNVLQQTGSGGLGAAQRTVRVRLPTTVRRYIRVRATNSGTGNASAKSMSASLLL